MYCRNALLAAALTVPSLFGDIITGSGGTTVPDVFNNSTGLTQVASITGAINPLPGTGFDARYSEYVFRDANATALCPAGGCLDFFLVFVNSAMSPLNTIVERATIANFSGFSTDIGYDLADPSGITLPGGIVIDPADVDRSADPSGVIGFSFITGAGTTPVGVAQSSALLEIQTNAVTYAPGLVSLQDGVAGTNNGFAPALSAVPEPASLLLLGSVLLAISSVRNPTGKR
jgi:hypothetical protein